MGPEHLLDRLPPGEPFSDPPDKLRSLPVSHELEDGIRLGVEDERPGDVQ